MCGASLLESDLFAPDTCCSTLPLDILLLEGSLLALEATTATAAAEATATTTTATTTATTKVTTTATTAAATTTAAEAATTATAATATTAAAVLVTGLGEIKADWSAIEITAVELVKGVLGIINRVERHVSEALGPAIVPEELISNRINTCQM